MKTRNLVLLLPLLVAAALTGATFRAGGADSLALTTPAGRSSYVSTGPTLGQALVDAFHKKHPKITSVVLHSVLPNGKDYATVAATDPAKVGGLDNDLDIGVEERQNMYVQAVVADDYAETVIIVPAKDASGATLKAAWEFVLPSNRDSDQAKLLAAAMAMRDALAKKIPSLSALLEPPSAG